MPRYFFDISDGDQTWFDCVGLELADMEAAKLAAVDALPDMARDELPDGEHRVFTVAVRNEEGVIGYRASLTFEGSA